MKCFFDSSRTKLADGPSWLTLAGFVAGDWLWNRFNNEWKAEVLQKREPHAPYPHMSRLYSTDGDFKGFTKERWNSLIFDAVNYLQNLPKLALCAIVCTIDELACKSLVAPGFTISDPHLICAECCIGTAFSWRLDNCPDGLELARIYFDRNEKFMHHFRQRWLREKKRQRPVITNTFWGLVEDAGALNMRETPALQAADMLAWATSCRHSGIERSMRHLMDVIEKVVPTGRFMLDADTLKGRYIKGGG
jgi:hypothetical protein